MKSVPKERLRDYLTLVYPPLRLQKSKVISSIIGKNESESKYVFEDSSKGKQQAISLLDEIMVFENGKERVVGLSREAFEFNNVDYKTRVYNKFTEAFDDGNNFHMQKDLETYLGSTNLPTSTFRREGGVVLFNLAYFAPAYETEREEIEKKLGLEKHIDSVSMKIGFSRVGGGIFFKIPCSKYLINVFDWLKENKFLMSDVKKEIDGYGYSLDFVLKGNQERGNVYKFTLELPNIHQQWKKEIQTVNGSLFGSAVSKEFQMTEGNLKDERYKLEKLDKEYSPNDIIVTEYCNKGLRLYLQNPVLEMKIGLKENLDYNIGVQEMKNFFRRDDLLYFR